MSENKITKLPEQIVVPQREKDADRELRQSVKNLQAAFDGLQAVEEVHPIPSLQEINPEWLHSQLAQRIELVEADLTLTEYERQNRLQAWKAIRATAMMHANTICKVLADWPEAYFVFDNEENNYLCANIESVARSRATHETSSLAKEHWKLIQQTLDFIKNLRRWEDEHDIVWRPLANYIEMQPQTFAEMWATGGAKFNHKYEHLTGRQNNPKTIII